MESNQARKKRLHLRMTAHERAKLDDAGASLGLTVSDTIRAAIQFVTAVVISEKKLFVVHRESGMAATYGIDQIDSSKPHKVQSKDPLTACVEVVQTKDFRKDVGRLLEHGFGRKQSEVIRRAIAVYEDVLRYNVSEWEIMLRGEAHDEKIDPRVWPPSYFRSRPTSSGEEDLAVSDQKSHVGELTDYINAERPGRDYREDLDRLAAQLGKPLPALIDEIAELVGKHLLPDLFSKIRSVTDLNDRLATSGTSFQRIVLRLENVNDLFAIRRGLAAQHQRGASIFILHPEKAVAEKMALALREATGTYEAGKDSTAAIIPIGYSPDAQAGLADRRVQFLLFDDDRPSLAHGLDWHGCDEDVPYTVMVRRRVTNASDEVSPFIQEHLPTRSRPRSVSPLRPRKSPQSRG